VQFQRVAAGQLGKRQDDASALLEPHGMVVRIDWFGSEIVDALMRVVTEPVCIHGSGATRPSRKVKRPPTRSSDVV
jgi:hypothetical protein